MVRSMLKKNLHYALATSTGYAGRRPLPWLACDVARALGFLPEHLRCKYLLKLEWLRRPPEPLGLTEEKRYPPRLQTHNRTLEHTLGSLTSLISHVNLELSKHME